MRYTSAKDEGNPYRPQGGRTAVTLVSQHTGGSIIALSVVLTRECQATIAKQTGTRFAPIDGGPGYDGIGWAKLGYCYKQAPDIPIVDTDGSHGTVRPFAKEYEDFKKAAEQSLRQLRADITRLKVLEVQAATDPVKRLEYVARCDDFLNRNGRQWFALAADYLPELLSPQTANEAMVEGRENKDDGR